MSRAKLHLHLLFTCSLPSPDGALSGRNCTRLLFANKGIAAHFRLRQISPAEPPKPPPFDSPPDVWTISPFDSSSRIPALPFQAPSRILILAGSHATPVPSTQQILSYEPCRCLSIEYFPRRVYRTPRPKQVSSWQQQPEEGLAGLCGSQKLPVHQLAQPPF